MRTSISPYVQSPFIILFSYTTVFPVPGALVPRNHLTPPPFLTALSVLVMGLFYRDGGGLHDR